MDYLQSYLEDFCFLPSCFRFDHLLVDLLGFDCCYETRSLALEGSFEASPLTMD